jgi:hypothetical protein
MSHLLIPGPATADSAVMWAAAIDEPDDPKKLELVTSTGVRHPFPDWQPEVLEGGNHRVRYGRVEIKGLSPRIRRPIELRSGSRRLATATLGTLPDRVPGLEERPFTILLGSCFAEKKDGAGNVGRTYAQLPSDVRPDLKLLCGDQVYLDAPSFWTIFPAVRLSELRRRLLETYLAAWTQEPGYHTLLADGPNAFTADDHDFWNNAPRGSITAPATMIPAMRDRWLAEATRLYRAFQRPEAAALTAFDMTGLSIRVGEVRINRTESDERFMSAADLEQIRIWVRDLDSPGCLVLGQVLFSAKAGTISKHMDLGLPDFKQYSQLLEILRKAPHTIVILTGDVHFGRVSVCEMLNGQEIVEVVASPLSLVAKVPANDWKAAPNLFPAQSEPGFVSLQITTDAKYQFNGNHFATIGFNRAGGRVRMKVQAWPTENSGRPPAPVRTYEKWIS